MFSGGTGVVSDPYLISTIQDFKDMENADLQWFNYFKQINDISFTSEPTYTQPLLFNVINNLICYDGQNYKLSNITMNGSVDMAIMKEHKSGYMKNIVLDNIHITTTNGKAAILSISSDEASYENITINSNCSVTGTSLVGGICAIFNTLLNPATVLLNCTSSVDIICSGSYSGGLTGSAEYNCYIDNCTTTVNCSVNGNDYAGGISGNGYRILNCTNTATVNGDNYVGGITGYCTRIENCINNGSVTGNNNYVGGISGYSKYVKRCKNNSAIVGDYWVAGITGIGYTDMDVGATADTSYIEFCKNYGSVSGYKYIGGIAGMRGFVLICSNEGTITATNIHAGGIVGYGDSIRNCYNSGSVSASNYAGGICGYQVSYGGTSDDGRNMISELNLSTGNISAITHGGGLCGYSTNMTNSVALMANITRTSGTDTTFGRLYGAMATAFTTYGQGLSTSTFNGSGETPNHNETATGKDGADITAENAKLVASYDPADKMPIYFYNATTNPDGFWDIVATSTYPYHVTTYSLTLEETGDFPNANETTTGKDGANSGGTTPSEYTTVGWNTFYWNLIEGSYPTHYLTELSTYFFDTSICTGNNGTDVTLANAKKRTTYETLGWNFTDPWLIFENATFPYQIQNIPTVSFFKVRTSTEWLTAPIKMYTGTEWLPITTKIYSGTEWI